jgi:mannan endo-1,6-alpha-mannosidase
MQKVFFPEQYGGNVMTEYACEANNSCDKDQRSFKAYLARWLAVSATLAPFTAAQIMPWLQGSATAALKVCSQDASSNVVCGRKWYETNDDGTRDIGNQMSTMSVVQANLIQAAPQIVNVDSGTSAGNAAAGGPATTPTENLAATRKITTGDKAGAWLLTIIMLVTAVGLAVFMCTPDDKDTSPGMKWPHLRYRTVSTV